MRNGFFPKAVKLLVLYLLGNGAVIDGSIKTKIDKKFDRKMIQAAMNACVDGVVWVFADINKLNVFRATEFVPLFDERTNEASAGIRFWQIDAGKPMYIELYEIDGITEYKTNSEGSGLIEIMPKRPFRQTIRRDAFKSEVVNSENYGIFPIFPLYANELRRSELSPGLKALIDAHDFISSDLVDGITLLEGIYWVVKNFNGDDTAELINTIQELKTVWISEQEDRAEPHALEIPFEAKKAALDLLERRMYADWLLPDNRLSTANATATEIKMSREEIDVKADFLEWHVAECIENILRLKGFDGSLPDYKRRTAVMDTDEINNISTKLTTGWIDAEEAILEDPTIPEDRKNDLIQRLKLRDAELDSMKFPPDKEVSDDAEPGT